MILGFKGKRTELFAKGEFVRAFQGFDRQAPWKRLEILDATVTLADLAGLPSNRLEALRGDRAGQHSIRINQQWRMCFEWSESAKGPSNVEIVDYH
jgi:proteic killer suppression protein